MTAISHTEREIFSQPETWATTLEHLDMNDVAGFWRSAAPSQVMVTGCGSTFYLALTVASQLRDELGVMARATPASEIALGSGRIPDIEGTVLIALSRSGTTTETLSAVARFKDLGGKGVIAITNYPEATLAARADVVLAAPAGQEESVAQTRSFSSMLLSAHALIGELSGQSIAAMDALPELGSKILVASQEPMTTVANDSGLTRFAFLGSDPLFGIASEGMLKLKEMSLTDSEAFHTLEYRHGPISMAERAAAVIGLISHRHASTETAVVSDATELGAVAMTVGAGATIGVPDSVPQWARPVLYLPPLQILALERARSKGLDPDRPRNLVAVIELDSLGTTPVND